MTQKHWYCVLSIIFYLSLDVTVFFLCTIKENIKASESACFSVFLCSLLWSPSEFSMMWPCLHPVAPGTPHPTPHPTPGPDCRSGSNRAVNRLHLYSTFLLSGSSWGALQLPHIQPVVQTLVHGSRRGGSTGSNYGSVSGHTHTLTCGRLDTFGFKLPFIGRATLLAEPPTRSGEFIFTTSPMSVPQLEILWTKNAERDALLRKPVDKGFLWVLKVCRIMSQDDRDAAADFFLGLYFVTLS